jgi:hypothetical protein
MSGFSLLFAVTVTLTQTPPAGEAKQPRTREVRVRTPNGLILSIVSDGSGRLQYGSSALDGWSIKAGTFDASRVMKDLKALTSDPKGGLRGPVRRVWCTCTCRCNAMNGRGYQGAVSPCVAGSRAL